MSAITAKASRKMKKYAVLTREPRCFLGSFDFSWEQRKLGELVDRVVRKNINNESTLPLTISAQYGLVDQITYFNNRVASRDVSNYYLVLNGEFAYNKSTSDGYPFGAVKRLDLYEKGVLSTLYIVFAPKKEQQIASDFLTVFFDTDRWHKGVAERAAEGARNHGLLNIPAEDFFDIDLSVPKDIAEQKQIGAFIRQLDHLITLHQRKCALLFSSFQALISMMFTTSTFSWEQRKFSNITFPAGEKNKDNLPLESYSITNEHGFVPQDEKFENGGTMREADKRMYYIVSPNSFAYNPARINVGSIGYQNVGKNVIVSSLYEVFKTSEDVDDRLLWHWFKSPDFQKLIMQLQEGGVRLYFYYDKLCMGEVSLPSLEEQRKIGKLLDTLDNLITLHQRKCISFTGRAGRLISTVNKKRITSSWEQRKLGDMMNVTSVKRIHQSDWTDSGVRFLRARDIVAAAKNEEPDDYLYISKEKYEEYSALSGKVGVSDLLVTGVGTIGVPYLVRNLEPLYFKDGNIIWFQNSSKIDGKFLFYSFSAEQIQGFINESAGIGTVGTYTIESGKKTPISLPNQIEQARVGEFFQQLDNLITLHQRKPFLMKWRTSDVNRNQTNRLVL